MFDYPDSQLSGLFTEVPMSPDNRGLTALSSSAYEGIMNVIVLISLCYEFMWSFKMISFSS